MHAPLRPTDRSPETLAPSGVPSAFRKHLALSLSMCGLVVASACTNTVGQAPVGLPVGSNGRPVEFFSENQGTSSLSIRIVDERKPRGVQTIGDADSYNGVLLHLSNSTRLKNDLVSAASKQSGTYAGVFNKLPSDNGGHYLLTVSLFRNVTTPTSKDDAAYSAAHNKVGEGSATFSLTPGENKTVVVTINAVGNLTLTSGGQTLAPTALTSGQTGVTLDTHINTLKDPDADAIKVYVLDGNNATQSTTTLPAAGWPASPATATTSLTVPTLGAGVANANYSIVVDLLKGTALLSRRSQAITVSAVAATPTPAPTPTPTPSPSPSSAYPAGLDWNGQWSNGGHSNIDSAGTLYFCDPEGTHKIYKVASGSVTPVALTTFPAGAEAYTIAVGPNDTLWAAGAGAIWQINKTTGAATVMASGLANVYISGICWTPSGLIYYGAWSADPTKGGVKIYNPRLNEFYDITFPDSDKSQAVVSDPQGNVYVQLVSTGKIEKLTPVGAASVFVSGLETGSYDLGLGESGLVTDGTNFFSLSSGKLFKFPANNPTPVTPLGSGFRNPTWNNLAIDAAHGHLYVSRISDNKLVRVDFNGNVLATLFSWTDPYF